MEHKGVGLDKLRFTGYAESWEQKKLGEVADWVNGYAFKPSDLSDEGVPVIKIKELLNNSELVVRTTPNTAIPNNQIINKGDLIFSWSMTLATRIWDAEQGYLNQHLYKVIPVNEIINKGYLHHCLTREIPALKKKMHGGTAKHITRPELLEHQIRIPSLPEQERIGGFLSALDERLRVQSELVDLLAFEYTGYSQRIFNQTLRFKDENGNQYPDWEQKKLGEIFEKYTDTTIHVSDDEEYTQVTISKNRGILRRGTIMGEKIGRKRQFVIDLEKYPDTLTFIRQGVFDGSIGFVPEELHGAIVTENMPLLDLNNQLASKEYMTNYFNSYDYYIKVLQPIKPSGSAQKALHEKDWLKQEIPLPSLPEQEKIGGFLSALSARIEAERALLAQYKEQKKAYLQKLLP